MSDRVFCGGQPESETHIAALAKRNVSTIVSVDASPPALALAAKHGIRCIHIPIGYGEVDEDARGSLTRVAREVEGAIYVHCHHGKHRGPTAAALIAIAAGEINQDEAIKVLVAAGTNKNYAGLWQSIRSFRVPAKNARLPELVEVAKTDPFTTSMARIGIAMEKLKRLRDKGWQPSDDPNELESHQHALLIKQGFHESRRAGRNPNETAFTELLLKSEKNAEQLTDSLNKGDVSTANECFRRLMKSCSHCHDQYR